MTSLPVPLSPRIMTVASVAAALPGLFGQFQHDGAAALGMVGFAERLQPSFQPVDLLLQVGVGERPLHHQQKIFPLERLLQVIECAVAHGQHRALHRSERREKNDGQAGMRLVQPREDLLARHPRHPHVQQHQVGRLRERVRQALDRIRVGRHGGLGKLQHPLNVLTHRRLVVDHEDAIHDGLPPTNQWYGWPRDKTRRGHLDDETGSAAGPLFIPQTAVVHIEEAGAQKESEPQPLPPRTLGNERLEQVLPDDSRERPAHCLRF